MFTAIEFIQKTGWGTPFNLVDFQTAFNHFQRNVPEQALLEEDRDPSPWALKMNGKVFRLTQWMQSIDFSRPVSEVLLKPQTKLLSFQSSVRNNPGNWFTDVGAQQGKLAIDRSKNLPVIYSVQTPVMALRTSISDAYVDWAMRQGIGPEYRRGGGIQYFIWNGWRFVG